MTNLSILCFQQTWTIVHRTHVTTMVNVLMVIITIVVNVTQGLLDLNAGLVSHHTNFLKPYHVFLIFYQQCVFTYPADQPSSSYDVLL